MSSVGPNSATNCPNTAAGDFEWDNFGVTGILEFRDAADGYSASAFAFTGGGQTVQTNTLNARGFGFSIPAGATIDGVVVNIGKFEDVYDPTKYVTTDVTVKLFNGTAQVGSNKASATAWPDYATYTASAPSYTTYTTYGGSTDDWGASLTDSQVNSADFGVDLVASVTDTDTGVTNFTANVDFVEITIYYTSGGGAINATGSSSVAITTSGNSTTSATGSSAISVTNSGSPIVNATGSSSVALTTSGSAAIVFAATGTLSVTVATMGSVVVCGAGSSSIGITTQATAVVNGSGSTTITITNTGTGSMVLAGYGDTTVVVLSTGNCIVLSSGVCSASVTASGIPVVVVGGSNSVSITTSGTPYVYLLLTPTGLVSVGITSSGSSTTYIFPVGQSNLTVAVGGSAQTTIFIVNTVTSNVSVTAYALIISLTYFPQYAHMPRDAVLDTTNSAFALSRKDAYYEKSLSFINLTAVKCYNIKQGGKAYNVTSQ